jgi:hypothetical protein
VRVVPPRPGQLHLAVTRLWDGKPPPVSAPRGGVWLEAAPEGLRLGGRLSHASLARIPTAPRGTRVDDLWRYDVIECFCVGEGGRYLEVELGAGGHFLALEFSGPRELARDHADFAPEIHFARDSEGWRSELMVPWERIPPGLRALNAFAIGGGYFLAHHPVPGARPDFHQPDAYPPARLAEEPIR